jgi:hypothetical protein
MRGTATIYYFEHDKPAGTRKVYCGGYDDGRTVHSAYYPNEAFVCRRCGDLWARTVWQFDFVYRPVPQLPWAICARDCVKCGDGLLTDDLEGASNDLVEREFLLELRRVG